MQQQQMYTKGCMLRGWTNLPRTRRGGAGGAWLFEELHKNERLCHKRGVTKLSHDSNSVKSCCKKVTKLKGMHKWQSIPFWNAGCIKLHVRLFSWQGGCMPRKRMRCRCALCFWSFVRVLWGRAIFSFPYFRWFSKEHNTTQFVDCSKMPTLQNHRLNCNTCSVTLTSLLTRVHSPANLHSLSLRPQNGAFTMTNSWKSYSIWRWKKITKRLTFLSESPDLNCCFLDLCKRNDQQKRSHEKHSRSPSTLRGHDGWLQEAGVCECRANLSHAWNKTKRWGTEQSKEEEH